MTRGTLSAASGASTTYTAPNRTGTYVLTATNGVDPPTYVTITVTGVFPYPPSWEYEGEADKNVLIWTPQVGPWQGNIKRGSKRKVDLVANLRPREEYEEVFQFWDEHYGREDLILPHPDLDLELTGRIDAKLKDKWHLGGNLVSWSTVFQEV
ncbi:MAG: hypothetical protein ICV60_18210 [Pyrinomonadaceae bacterium]|nr:hypothetical protein [Pyrinomonadaceae bacterium]